MSLISNNLEISGNLSEHPFAELLVEAAAVQLSGSFRLAHENHKAIVYLKDGKIVFAVSNARQHRLFEQLIHAGKLRKEQLSEFPNFANDLEFGQSLVQKEVFSKEEIDAEFSRQIEEILKTLIDRKTGEWVFSPIARIRENIAFTVDTAKLFIEYARNCSMETTAGRFKSLEESFHANSVLPQLNLSPQEGFIFSRFENQNLTIHDVQILCGLPDSEIFKSLYILWLGGFITRKNWNSAFTASKIAAINSARLTLKKEEPAPPEKQELKSRPEAAAPEDSTETSDVSDVSANTEVPLSLEEYLKRIESADHYYEMFDIPLDSELAAVKNAYFALARDFHPDKYHQETDLPLKQRVQDAFTEIARAYETLRSQEKRPVYDLRLRKNLELNVPVKKEPEPVNLNNEEKAKEEFERGFNYLMNRDYAAALPHLTRAVQFAPHIARYHAYFGKGLSADETQRFKADAEFQAAIKIEPNNPTFRILLAEFYIQYNLLKRAEGELNRLLVISPNNREAQALLDSLANK